MSGYPGRRGGPANMSALLQDLNRVPESVPQRDDNPPNYEDDLSMFAAASFPDQDWEMAHSVHAPATTIDSETASLTTSPSDRFPGEQGLGDLDFLDGMGGDFNAFDFQQYPAPNVNSFSDNLGTLPPPIQPSSNYSAGAQNSPYAPSMQSAGDKRPSDAGLVAPRRQLSFEDQTRYAAEEDKRRRNTAASARFRVKKKAREQALEKREKELGDKVGALESRVQSLETENKWLRELVMEKNGGAESIVSMLDKQKAADAKEKLAKKA